MRITFDFETRSASDLKKSGAWVYSEDPTTEVLCCWFALEDGTTISWYSEVYNRVVHGHDECDPFPEAIRRHLDNGATFEAHNLLFDFAIWNNVCVGRYGWPTLPTPQTFDTMAACARRALPLALDKASRTLHLEVEKNVEGSNALRRIMKPAIVKRGEPKQFVEDPELFTIVGGDYCRDDVLSQKHLGDRLGPLDSGEHQVWLLNQRMNHRGTRIDLPFVADCQAVVDKASIPLSEAFADLTGGLKATQRAKVLEWMNERQGDNPLPDTKKETVLEALAGDDLHPDVRTALELRGALTSTSIAKLKSMIACTASDGRAHGLIQYHAATTGRDGGRLLQPQNFPRGTVEDEKDDDGNVVPAWDILVPALQTRDAEYVGMLFAHHETHISPDYQSLTAPIAAVSSALRHTIIADEGRVLCAGDFSTIEVRVLLAIAGQTDKIDLIAKGLDPYLDYASDVMGVRMTDKVKYKKERQEIGKPGVLGLGFQMGARKLWAKDGKGKWDMDFAQKLVDTYRQEWADKVPALWEGLQEASIKCIYDGTPQTYNDIEYRLEDAWLTCRLPSGRKLYYFNPQKVTREMPWSTEERPDHRRSWTYTAMKSGRLMTVDAYGGLLTENVVQATARDLLYDRALAADANGYPVLLTVHDEMITEPLANRANDKELEEIMCDTPEWARSIGIPVAAECWVGERYRK